jgi:hypothetical protein
MHQHTITKRTGIGASPIKKSGDCAFQSLCRVGLVVVKAKSLQTKELSDRMQRAKIS